jgi:hypothetical protein
MRYYLDYGAKVSGTQLVRADRRITTAAFELNKCFDEVDAIVSPATPHAAPAFGRDMPDNAGTYCILANFAGAPRSVCRWVAMKRDFRWGFNLLDRCIRMRGSSISQPLIRPQLDFRFSRRRRPVPYPSQERQQWLSCHSLASSCSI